MQILLDQLVYFGFFQSLLLLLIYLFSPRNRQRIHGYMALFVAIVSVGLLGKVLYSAGIGNYNFRLISLSELSALLFGPTIYLFTRTVLKQTSYSRADWIHFIPGLLYSVFVAIYFVIPENATIIARSETGELMRMIHICHAVGLVVNISYWIKAVQIFRSFYSQMRNELSFEPQTRFLVNFLVVTAICLLIWTILLFISFFGYDMIERNARPYIWILLSLIILFVTYYQLISPQVLSTGAESINHNQKYAQSKLSSEDLERLKLELETLMAEKKPYLNSKLLKRELANMLGVNAPDLARLLNENIGMSFFEYINYHRIIEFVELYKKDETKQFTFFGLAQEAGFHSKTTFNKSFKKLMGSSPSVYFNKKI